MKILQSIGLGAAVALSFAVGSAAASEVFAEPVAAKGGQQSYRLTAFVDGAEDGMSFTVDLPKGARDVSLKGCGRNAADGFAKCHFEPSTGRLAVVLLRLDGQALAKKEYALGVVEFSGAAASVPLQASVKSARRGAAAAAVTDVTRGSQTIER